MLFTFLEVLQACYDCIKAVEVMVNSYERLKPTNKWSAAIPDDCYKVETYLQYININGMCSVSYFVPLQGNVWLFEMFNPTAIKL